MLVDEEGIWESGSVPVLVWRRGLWRARERETVTGTIADVERTSPRLVPDGSSLLEFSYSRYGSGVSAILPSSVREGARVTVTGRHAAHRGAGYLPMGPLPFVVEEVTFLDPPPELIADVAWRAYLAESRAPRVARTREEFDALNAEMATGAEGSRRPLDGVGHAKFGEEMVVVVFAGLSPSRDDRAEITQVRHDAEAETTWVEYLVIGPKPGRAGPAEWVEPYYAVILPARPGDVEFARTELLPDRPPWW